MTSLVGVNKYRSSYSKVLFLSLLLQFGYVVFDFGYVQTVMTPNKERSLAKIYYVFAIRPYPRSQPVYRFLLKMFRSDLVI